MKTIIMWQTLPLLCKKEEDINSLLDSGFEIKQTEHLQYLIKTEEI